jgi:hypothetical protein
MVLIRISVMNRRKYLMGVLGVASLAGCTGSNSGGNSQNQADTDEVDLFVRYNVEMIQDAHNPFGYESVSYGPHAAFATLIENRTSETLPPIGAAEEAIEAPFEPQPEMVDVWSVYDEIPAGEEKKGHFAYAADSMDANPSLVAASDKYNVAVERAENIAVEIELFEN